MRKVKGLRFIAVLGFVVCLLSCFSDARACYSYHDDCWNPPNIIVDSAHPYYFRLGLPGWDYDKGDYVKATLDLTYLDQCGLDINIFAADPASDLNDASSFNILLGRVPYSNPYHAGTAQFDLLTLDESTFEALFKGQSFLNLVADCHYVFDKAAIHLEADPLPTPLPAPILLLGSGLVGLLGFRRRWS